MSVFASIDAAALDRHLTDASLDDGDDWRDHDGVHCFGCGRTQPHRSRRWQHFCAGCRKRQQGRSPTPPVRPLDPALWDRRAV